MPAQVRSFETIQQVRDEVARFANRAGDGISELSGEIRRMIDWVEHDRPAYWKMRVSKAYDQLTEAKANLHRCLMYPINDEQPSCAEERANVKKAQAHLAHCQEKQERVRMWAHKLRHELHEYEGRMANLRTLVEEQSPRTVAMLDRTIESLEKYVSGSAGGPAPPPRDADPVSGADASGDDASPATEGPA